ncbi:alpha-N-acetylgalactosaminide alpha-2,6-sialyltransferase 1 isoform X1 [Octodon degus]|uniref:alpha-N-acetylgalactosaminide alpha-2,6-sialyltransferase n=1 Tax=Octodon degus TaxID=10160 RepID=A0A6P6ED09_OCTDE|nr:alpha-N-acetylgalactosaminide alpha-2,6-sialyltransferase 1 isoform X1 [Octodon degus]XP_023569898.1 alpha-N-acetylgalactosaminide alpha-2,6-sialyltransferase 1 isoform X1 [Octodon degus]
MRCCPRRPFHLGQGVLWPLLLALLIFFVFTVPFFIKEPSTKPSRYQYSWNNVRWAWKSLQNSMSLAPSLRQWTSIHAEPVQKNGILDTDPGPTAHPVRGSRKTEGARAPQWKQGTLPSAAMAALPERQGEEKTPGDALPLLVGTTALTLQSQGDQKGMPTKTRVLNRQQGKALATTGGVTTKTKQAKTTAAVPAKGKAAQGAPTPSPRPAIPGPQILKAANFKSEPRWDFEEKYSFDVAGLQTSCPDSVKVKASRSSWLQNLFLPNLTLFLDSSRFNQSEWERLEHFAPPFGFMELNHSLVQKVVGRFPPVPQQQLLLASLPRGSSHCITCAVVGNGGILNSSRTGQEIDSHDYVFRLSGALIKGYEQDVGTRTSFYGFTAFSLTQSLLSLGSRGFRHVPVGKDVRYLHFLEGTRDYEWLEALLLNQTLVKKNLFWFRRRPQEAFREALQMDKYLLLHPDFLRYMKNRFLRSKTLNTTHWRIYRPTTGALLLLTALQLCDKVSAYGFITEGHERFSDHYYDKTWKKLIFYINHDFKLEREVWKRLHDEGIIWLYQRPQTPNVKH